MKTIDRHPIEVSGPAKHARMLRLISSTSSFVFFFMGMACVTGVVSPNGSSGLWPGSLFVIIGGLMGATLVPYSWSLCRVFLYEDFITAESPFTSLREIPISELKSVEVSYWSTSVAKITKADGGGIRFVAGDWYQISDGTAELISLLESRRDVRKNG